MGNTADLAMVQKTNIDTLHKESKSQKVITERCGCLQSAVSKHIKCKVDCKCDGTVQVSDTRNFDYATLGNFTQGNMNDT